MNNGNHNITDSKLPPINIPIKCAESWTLGDPDLGIQSGSLPNISPISGSLAFSPSNRRRRLRNLSKRNVDVIIGTSSPTSIAQLPRDPIQPRNGSIPDVHRQSSLEDEEMDSFFPLGGFRPRSQTCPENHLWKRKVKTRNRNRPSTPPPSGADDTEIKMEIAKLAIRDRLRIKARDLPLSIPETVKDPDITSLQNTSSHHRKDNAMRDLDT